MNQFINFFWSIICFAPVVTYWVKQFDTGWFMASLALSAAFLFIPSKTLQLSNRPKFYESIGIKFIRRFVQNGEYANRSARIKNPHYKLIKNRTHAVSYKQTIAMYERFHVLCFSFFIITTLLAIVNHRQGLAAIIIIANIIYNICPLLLQQYNKARILKINKSII
ncbi:hypothetical protein ACFQZX_08165 [Mucilaginibacter litoreus]|uniref:Glycosyl-4,4'-diaponeurosporenoate acyltransferase n=1 Tax=Mucilaginibacter litoreus TaxID=1048221 RepID=A0ABW3ASU6_9SPHI